MSGIAGKVVAITGASSGIGEAVARLLAGRGAKVVLGARRTERLAALAREIGEGAAHRTLDVTDRAQVEAFVAFARERFGRLDVLVNNAGLMPLSPLDQGKVDEWDRMIDVNIKGTLYGIAAVLPVFRAQGSGHVVNIASVAGHRVGPNSAVYSATKHAVRALSEGLRQEAGPALRVTIVSPGAVESELAATISDAELKQRMIDYRRIAIPAAAVARAIAYALEQPPEVDVNEILIRPTAQPT
ncbi:putative oxidoreductase [Methylobacterium crusticola]|uniref:Oxidoreductase n=1 Tax=Methylobacterium crusticola TaxID=1697972 RepID=A0ABQ4QUY8_9HYPH|nr:SDR family oxidoreductase [Methylobacterium crusticola]GJD49153.1 putative oxidoreductase [Methylobacterium crusticola]